MNPLRDNPKDIIKRFCWIDNDRFRIIKPDGIELFIDATNGFK